MLIAVGDHRTAPVPSPLADDVHLGCEEGVGVANHGADVEVVLPVLDGNVKPVPPLIQVGHDRVVSPVAVAIDDVAPIALGEQRGVEAGVIGPGPGMWTDTLPGNGHADIVAESGISVQAGHTARTTSTATAATSTTSTATSKVRDAIRFESRMPIGKTTTTGTSATALAARLLQS